MITSILLGLALGFALTQIANFATTVYLHRALSHRALSLSAPLRIPFRLVIWITTGIRPRQWVAVHRKHHAHTDEDDDPHSPARLGWVRVQLLNVSLYRRHARDAETVEKYAKDLPQTRLDRWLLDHALVGLGLLFVALLAVFGLTVAAIAWTFHVVLYLALSGSINAIAHTFGRRPFQTSATNVQWLAFVTAGEGLHNNHHAAPTSARFSLGRREIDPAWWFINLAAKLRLAEIRHVTPKIVVARSAA